MTHQSVSDRTAHALLAVLLALTLLMGTAIVLASGASAQTAENVTETPTTAPTTTPTPTQEPTETENQSREPQTAATTDRGADRPTTEAPATIRPEDRQAVAGPQTTRDRPGALIGPNTRLFESGYSDGMVWVEIESDVSQAIELWPAARLESSGEMDFRTVAVDGGERTRVEVEAPVIGGKTGVVIVTGSAAWKEAIEVESDVFDGDPTWQTTRTSGIGGLAAGFLTVALVAVLFVRYGGRIRGQGGDRLL